MHSKLGMLLLPFFIYHCDRLDEAALKYQNREPREIDLMKIAELGNNIKEKDLKIEALNVQPPYRVCLTSLVTPHLFVRENWSTTGEN
jgi:hypothetical protein